MRFTIAIIHRNGFKTLKSALDSILVDLSNNDEIIIIDNNSIDDIELPLSSLNTF